MPTATAQASANLYSSTETTKENNLEPAAYFNAIFRLLPQVKPTEDIEVLLPWNANIMVG